MKENYQLRFDTGEITTHETVKEVVDELKGRDYKTLEKFSFNGPDDTRLRLVNSASTWSFVLTYWNGAHYVELL